MSDRRIHEVAVDDLVVAFDGRVVEVFNDPDGSIRMHVSRMKIKTRPGFKSHLYVELRAERRNTPGHLRGQTRGTGGLR